MSQPPLNSTSSSDTGPFFGRFIAVAPCSQARSDTGLETANGPQPRTGPGSYSAVFLDQGATAQERAGLDHDEIRTMAGSIGAECPLVLYGIEEWGQDGEFERIASDLDSVLVDVRLLARILLPGLQDYELNTVASFLGCVEEEDEDVVEVDTEQEYPDPLHAARATARVCLELLDMLLILDPDTLSTLVSLSEGTGIGLERLFPEMERSRAAKAVSLRHARDNRRNPPFDRGLHTIGDGSYEPGEDADDLDLLDPNELAGLFDTGGLFESRMEGYEQRSQQVSMVRGVVRAFNQGEVLLVEAGTGTGKSLSYLTPALVWAVQNDQRVIISTNTRNLQEQLYYKDLPFLLDNLGLAFRATLLKGRSNYLCRDRWRQVTRRPGDHLTPDEREAAIPLVVWARETKTGDISEHAGFSRGAGRGLWEKINGEGTACPRCVFKEECFVSRVRTAAMASHVVIVNHALLFSDLQADHAVLSRYTHLIIDEAHNLERSAVQHLTLEIGGWRMRGVLSKMYTAERGGTGVLAGLDRLASRSAENQEWKAPLAAGTRMAIDRLMEVNRRIEEFFRIASDEAYNHSYDRSTRKLKLRYRANDDYAEILRSSAPVLIGSCASLREALGTLYGTLDYVPDSWLDDREIRMNAVQAAMEFCREMEERLYLLTLAEEEDRVYWVEASRSHPMSCVLTGAPLQVAERLHDDLFSSMRTVVLTSATLTVGEKFDYQLERLGLDRIAAPRLQVQGIGSPFDYEDQVLVGVPANFPSPRSEAFQGAISRLILDLVVSTRRSTLVLFTSYNQLNRTFQDIEPTLAEHGVPALAQGTSGPRSALLDRFRRSDTAVLLGTDSFWEGVDVPGKALEMVILVKLPFAVPTEPLVQAQVERLEEAGRNSFLEFQVPEAVIKFRQGFGRLIRSTRDYGVVTILDQRVISTAYGGLFLDSLPARSEIFPHADALAEGVTYWFKARDRRRVDGSPSIS